MDRGAWGATVHGVAKSQTQLSNFSSAQLKIHIVQTLSSIPKMNNKLQTGTFDREQIFSTTDMEEKTQDLLKCKSHRPYNTVFHERKC